MPAISNIKALIRSMNPELVKGDFAFCTIPEKNLSGISAKQILVFREKEGITLIIEKKDAMANSLPYEGV